MARTVLATTAVPKTGVSSAMTAATTDGHIVDVGDDLILVVVNKAVASTTVTVQTPLQIEGLDVPEVALVVAAGATGFLVLDRNLYRRPAAPDKGKAYVNVLPITTAFVAVVQR